MRKPEDVLRVRYSKMRKALEKLWKVGVIADNKVKEKLANERGQVSALEEYVRFTKRVAQWPRHKHGRLAVFKRENASASTKWEGEQSALLEEKKNAMEKASTAEKTLSASTAELSQLRFSMENKVVQRVEGAIVGVTDDLTRQRTEVFEEGTKSIRADELGNVAEWPEREVNERVVEERHGLMEEKEREVKRRVVEPQASTTANREWYREEGRNEMREEFSSRFAGFQWHM